MNPFPVAFAVAMQAQLGEAFPAFRDALLSPAPVSVRFHLLKNKTGWENSEKVKLLKKPSKISQNLSSGKRIKLFVYDLPQYSVV